MFCSLEKEKFVAYSLLCLGCLTISFNIAAVTASIPAISLDLALPDLLVSRMISYYLISYGLGALMYAPLTRYCSYRVILVAVMIFYALSCLLCATAGTLNQLLIARIGMGVTAAGAIPIGLMVIGEFFDKNLRGRLVGVFFSCAFVAAIMGLLASGFVGWRSIFYIPACIGLLLSMVLLTIKKGPLCRKHRGYINYVKAFQNTKIIKVFCFIFMISALYHGVHKWYGIYLARLYGLDQFSISFFFILTIIGGMLGQLTGGVLSDKRGRLTACYIGVTGLSVAVMFLMRNHSLLVLGCVLFMITVFWTIGHNGLSTILTDFPDDDRPVIASLNSSVRFIGGGLGFFVSSFFVEQSFSLTFFVIGCLLFLLTFLIGKTIPT